MRWIPTKTMATLPGSDQLSRRNLSETYDPQTLSREGAETIVSRFGNIKVDCFSSPTNNCFETKYCSTFYDLEDKNNLQSEGIHFLTSQDLVGRFWIFCPDDLAIPVMKLISELNWDSKVNKLQILLLVKSSKVRDALGIFWSLKKKENVNLSWTKFASANEKSTYLNFKTKSDLILFSMGKYYK